MSMVPFTTIASAMPVVDALVSRTLFRLTSRPCDGAATEDGVRGVGAALLGGAILGGMLAAPYYTATAPTPTSPALVHGPGYGGNAVAYCMQRFRSYDPGSGTYLGFDGFRHPCP